MIIRKSLKLSREDYYKKHLEIINNFIPIKMSKKEIEIMGSFMRIPELIRFEAQGKKIVKKEIKLSDGGLSNHLKSLRNKGIIVELEGKEIIPLVLFPEYDNQIYEFKISVDGI